jgi:hypothetical protein
MPLPQGVYLQSVQIVDDNGNPAHEPDGQIATPTGVAASATAAGVLYTIDTLGYDAIIVHRTSAGTGCTSTYEASNDGVNWVNVPGKSLNLGTLALTDNAVVLRTFATLARYFRERVSTYGSGTVTSLPILRTGPSDPTVNAQVQGAVTVSGTVNTNASLGINAPGNTVATVASAAGTNLTSVKSSAGNLSDFLLTNNSAADKVIKFYDKSTAPVLATDVPKFKFTIKAGQTLIGNFSTPLRFTVGIAYAITGAVANTDTTATAVDDVTGLLSFA